jgi:hypothetical protein
MVAAIGDRKLAPPKLTKWSSDDMAFEPTDRPKRQNSREPFLSDEAGDMGL